MSDLAERMATALEGRYTIERSISTVFSYSEAQASARRYATRPEGRWFGVFQEASVRGLG